MNEYFKKALKTIKQNWESYIPVAICFLCLMLMNEYITAILNEARICVVEKMDVKWFGVITIMSALVYIAVLSYKIYLRNFYVSHSTINWWLTLSTIYSFYRFYNNEFEFWGFDFLSLHIAYLDFWFLPLLILLIYKVVYHAKHDNTEKKCLILKDNAIEKDADDIFGYNDIAKRLLSELYLTDVSESSFSVGISGKWGIGKSSFLNLMAKAIEADKQIVVRFYPRSSAKVEYIQDDFLNVLKDSLSKYHSGFGRIISKYISAIRVYNDETIFSRLASSFETLNVEEEREKINNSLKSIGRKVFVIVEDLDRLTGEELLEVFKLIDRNGNFSNVFYLSAYDKDYVNDVLGETLSRKCKQPYTDKYFNYELPLPVQRSYVIKNYIKKYLEGYAAIDGLVKDEIISEWDRVGNHVVEALGTLRHVKRFVNLFMSKYPYICQDVNIGDFLLLTLIRYKCLPLYDAIARMQLVTQGGILKGSKTTIYRIADFDTKIDEICKDALLKGCVEQLFPTFQESPYGDGIMKRLRRSQSFDLYFFDYKDIGIYNKDLAPLFEIEDDKEAIDKLSSYLDDDKNWESIEEFLRYRDRKSINSPKKLKRYLKLIILAYHKQNRVLNYYASFMDFLRKDSRSEYLSYKAANDETEYNGIVISGINEMIPYADLSIGLFFNAILGNALENPLSLERLIIDSQPNIVYSNIALDCLKSYIGRTEDERNPRVVLNLAMILPETGIKIKEEAKKILSKELSQRADEYGKYMLIFNTLDYENPRSINIALYEPQKWKLAFDDWDVTFPNWASKLSNKELAKLLKRLQKKYSNGITSIKAVALKQSYERNDYAAFNEAIDNQEKIDEANYKKRIILEHIKNTGSFKIKEVSEVLKLQRPFVSAYIKELVSMGWVAKESRSYKYVKKI